jgi:creatinine deaminase
MTLTGRAASRLHDCSGMTPREAAMLTGQSCYAEVLERIEHYRGIIAVADDDGSQCLGPAEQTLMDAAFAQAAKSFAEGGLPIGAVLARDAKLLAAGDNRRVQNGDPIAHGEMDCLRTAGRLKSYKDLTLFTTLSPCMMCSGTIVQFKIPRVIIGENRTFGGNEDFLRARGVEVLVLDDARCVELMRRFQCDHPDVWKEDIAE